LSVAVPFLNRPDPGTLRTIGELSALGFAFLLALALGYWFGLTLDSWLGTSPWLTVVFSLFGLAAGVVNVYRIVAHAMRSERRP
jgi:F0F1-type ATP synthase assembly protein I